MEWNDWQRAFGEAKSPPSLVPSFRLYRELDCASRRRLAARSHYRNTRRRLRGRRARFVDACARGIDEKIRLNPRNGSLGSAPPFVPYAPALQQHGVNIDRLLMIHPTSGMKNRLWAIEQPCARGRARACWPGSGPSTSFCGACSWRPRIKDAGCCCFGRQARAYSARRPRCESIWRKRIRLRIRLPAWRSSNAEAGGRASSI